MTNKGNTQQVLENKVDGYLCDADQVRGGYQSVANLSSIPDYLKIDGALFFNKADNKYYRYKESDSSWVEQVGVSSADVNKWNNKKADLDNDGKVPLNQLPSGLSVENAKNLVKTDDTVVSADDILADIANLKTKVTAFLDVNDVTLDQLSEIITFINTKAGASELASGLAGKVDKVSGKGLSTNDLTNALVNLINGALQRNGGDLTGDLKFLGKDLKLGTSSSSSNDSGDLVFLYGDGSEKMRIWSDDTCSSYKGPNYRVYNSSGSLLGSGRLATTSDIPSVSAAALTANLGLGTLNNSATWGTVSPSNGYNIIWGMDNPSGGGVKFAEKGGQTYLQIDGDFYGQEGQRRVAYVDEIPSTVSWSSVNGKPDLIENKGNITQLNDGTSITSPGGAHPTSFKTNSSGKDTGIFCITDDNAYICNSSDDYYTFAVFDSDLTTDFSAVDDASFVVLSNGLGCKIRGENVATQSWVQNQGYLTSHQSLSGYATESWVNSNLVSKSTLTLESWNIITANDTCHVTITKSRNSGDYYKRIEIDCGWWNGSSVQNFTSNISFRSTFKSLPAVVAIVENKNGSNYYFQGSIYNITKSGFKAMFHGNSSSEKIAYVHYIAISLSDMSS